MASIINLEAIRGDTWAWEFTVLQRDRETPQDITGAQFRFTAKYDPADSDVDAPIVGTTGGGQCQVTSAENGLLQVTIAPTQTTLVTAPSTLRYDLQATDGAGRVWTVARGKLEVAADISRSQP